MIKFFGRQANFRSCIKGSGASMQHGFTLIEMIVTITIIVILAGLLLTRVWFYQEQAEKAAMEQVAGALQSSLVMQYGHMLANGQEAEAKNLVTENPIHWLQREPANYAGEFPRITPATVEAGNWAYDMQAHELVYVPYRAEYFTPGKDGVKWVRYRAHFEYDRARNVASTAKKSALGVSSVLFVPVEPYQWLIPEE